MEVQCQKLANQYTMLNRILIHLERFHYIAACSDTLTTAGFHRKSNTESQQLGILSNLIADVVIGRHLYIYTFSLYFKGRKQIRKAETFVSSVSIHFLQCFYYRSGPAACWKQALGFVLG